MKTRCTLLGIAVGIVISSCMIIPYYKTMPYLPAVTGHVLEKQSQSATSGARICWKNEGPGYCTQSDETGHFHMDVVQKYITWKLVAMDPGWGGTLMIECADYVTVERRIGGLYDPSRVFDVVIELEKAQ